MEKSLRCMPQRAVETTIRIALLGLDMGIVLDSTKLICGKIVSLLATYVHLLLQVLLPRHRRVLPQDLRRHQVQVRIRITEEEVDAANGAIMCTVREDTLAAVSSVVKRPLQSSPAPEPA